MTTMLKTPPKSPLAKYAKPAAAATLTQSQLTEISDISNEAITGLRRTCAAALRIGLRLLALYQNGTDSFGQVLDKLSALQIPRTTAQRWMNASAAVLMKAQETEDADELVIPPWDAKSRDWKAAETLMETTAATTSIRRLLLGAANSNSDERRLEELIEREETGDAHAAKALQDVAEGKMTLVQAMRAAAGAAATKGKERNDPVYLSLDGRTGQIRGLFPKSVLTIRNAFARWEQLDEPARKQARSIWMELVANLPRELR